MAAPTSRNLSHLLLQLPARNTTGLMAPLNTISRACLRNVAFRSLVPARAMGTTAALCNSSATSSYSSPFTGYSKGSNIPDFSKYKTSGGEGSTKLFSYFAVGTMGAISAAAAKSTVQGKLHLRLAPAWQFGHKGVVFGTSLHFSLMS